MKSLRSSATDPNLKQAVMESVRPCKDILTDRLTQMEVHGSNMQSADVASPDDINHFFRHILKIDETMTPGITTKAQLSKHEKFLSWEKNHVVASTQYTHQLKNCGGFHLVKYVS